MKRRLTPCPPPTWVLPEQLWKPLHWPQKHLTSEKKKRQLCEVNTQHGTEQGTQSKCLTVLDRLLCIASTRCIASFTDFWRSLIASWRSPCSVHLCWTILIGCFFGIFHHWTITTLIKGILLEHKVCCKSAPLNCWPSLRRSGSWLPVSPTLHARCSRSLLPQENRRTYDQWLQILQISCLFQELPLKYLQAASSASMTSDSVVISVPCLQNVYRMCLKLWT